MRKLLAHLLLLLVLPYPIFAGWSDAWDDEYRIDYGNITTDYTTNNPPITKFLTRDVLALDMYEAIKERDVILLLCKNSLSWSARPSLGHGPRFYRFEALNFRNIRQWIAANCQLTCSSSGYIYIRLNLAGSPVWSGPTFSVSDPDGLQGDDISIWTLCEVEVSNGVIDSVFQRWLGDIFESLV